MHDEIVGMLNFLLNHTKDHHNIKIIIVWHLMHNIYHLNLKKCLTYLMKLFFITNNLNFIKCKAVLHILATSLKMVT